MPESSWPPWWGWELELTPHVLKRMLERAFSETDLRGMLEDAVGLKPDVERGRWAVQTVLSGQAWEVIVEPDRAAELLVVVTAYPLE